MGRAVRTVWMVGAVIVLGTSDGGRVGAAAPGAAAMPPPTEAHLVIGYRPGASAAELIPVHARLGARVVRNIVAVHAAVVALPLDTAAAAAPPHSTLFGDEAAAAATSGIRSAQSTLSPDVAAAAHLYAALPAVAYVQADVPAAIAAPAPASGRGTAPTARTPLDGSDPLAADQWHLDATRLPEAWAHATADGVRIAVVAAAGNAGALTLDHPAADRGALAVGAVDVNGARTAWSNRGAGLRLLAPGDAILTTVRDGYGVMSGTSLAAAIVGGVAALMIAQRPDAGPEAIAHRLIATAASPAVAATVIVDAGAATAGTAADGNAPAARLPAYWRQLPTVLLPAVYR